MIELAKDVLAGLAGLSAAVGGVLGVGYAVGRFWEEAAGLSGGFSWAATAFGGATILFGGGLLLLTALWLLRSFGRDLRRRLRKPEPFFIESKGPPGLGEPRVTDYCLRCGHSPESGIHVLDHAYVDPRLPPLEEERRCSK